MEGTRREQLQTRAVVISYDIEWFVMGTMALGPERRGLFICLDFES